MTEVIIALVTFVLVTTITPGPNNLLFATSGIRFGMRRTIPHVIGVQIGVYSLVIICGLGVGQLLLASPLSIFALKVFGSLYLLYLAWHMIGFQPESQDDGQNDEAPTASANPTGPTSTRPMTILEAGIFQFTNPKAWMMATAGLNISLGFDNTMTSAVFILCLGFGSLGAICNLAWVGMGVALRQWLAIDFYRYLINGSLAALTLLTVVFFWL